MQHVSRSNEFAAESINIGAKIDGREDRRQPHSGAAAAAAWRGGAQSALRQPWQLWRRLVQRTPIPLHFAALGCADRRELVCGASPLGTPLGRHAEHASRRERVSVSGLVTRRRRGQLPLFTRNLRGSRVVMRKIRGFKRLEVVNPREKSIETGPRI